MAMDPMASDAVEGNPMVELIITMVAFDPVLFVFLTAPASVKAGARC